MLLDPAQMLQSELGKFIGIGKAGEARDPIEFRAAPGQGLRLLIVDHLQPMFDDAEEAVGFDQFLGNGFGGAAGGGQGAQRRAGAANAQCRVPPAEDELLGLGEKFDLADAAAAELDVVAGHGDRAVAAQRVDLALDRVNVLDRVEIEVAAPDERTQRRHERVAGVAVRGNGPRFYHRRAFPILSHAFVIRLRGKDRDRGRGRARIGAQTQIGAENIAVGGALAQRAHHRLR